MFNTNSHKLPESTGFNPVALLFAIAGLGLLWGLLTFVIPPAPPSPSLKAPSERVVFVSPELLGIRIDTSEEEALTEQTPTPQLTASIPAPSRDTPPREEHTQTAPHEIKTASPPSHNVAAPVPEVHRPVGAKSHDIPPPTPKPVALQPVTPSLPVKVATPPPTPKPTPVPKGENRDPQKIRFVEPIYPPIARSQKLTGRVTVRITVGIDGSVENVKIEHSTSPLFNKAAMNAAKKMKFEPGLVNGRPSRMDYLQPFDFKTR